MVRLGGDPSAATVRLGGDPMRDSGGGRVRYEGRPEPSPNRTKVEAVSTPDLPDPDLSGAGALPGTGDPGTRIAERLSGVRQRVADAARAAGRDPAEVRILLATKTMPAAVILQAFAVGGTLIGENRVQEVLAKADALAPVPHETHFIGHLQSNKVNQVLAHISCLQTLDSAALADRLQARLAVLGRGLDVLIQVNVSGEASKSGVPPAEVAGLVAAVARHSRLTLRGFMTIGLNSPDRAEVRRGYAELAAIRDRAVGAGWPGADAATELSMGMSGDYPDAVAEGATIVRLGSAVFGPRAPASPADPARPAGPAPRG